MVDYYGWTTKTVIHFGSQSGTYQSGAKPDIYEERLKKRGLAKSEENEDVRD